MQRPRAATLTTFTVFAAALLLGLSAAAPLALAGDDAAEKAKKLQEYKAQFEDQKALAYTQRISLLSTIGSLGTPEAAAFLATIFEDTAEHQYVRRTAMSNCGRCKSPAQKAALAKYAMCDDPYLAAGAVDGLGNYGADAPLDALQKAAESSDSSLAYAGVNALVRANPADLNERLVKLAETCTVPMAGASIVENLARKKHAETVKIAKQFLGAWDKNQDVYRGRVVTALKTYGINEETAKVVLAELTAEGAGSYVKKAGIEALRTITEGAALDSLIEALEDKAAHVRMIVAEVLGGIQSPKVPDAIVEALDDEKDTDVKVALVETLVSLGADACDKAYKSLMDLSGDRDDQVALPAIHALGHCMGHADDKNLIKKLEKIAKTKRNPNQQSEGMIALARLRADSAFACAADGLKSREWRVQSAAVMALRVLRDIRAIDLLIDALGKSEGRLRGDIVTGLEDLTGKALPDDEQVWRTWWRANRDGFVCAPPMDDRAEDPQRAGGSTGFYGIAVRSLRVAFVLDVSGSMSSPSKFVPTGPNAPKTNPTKLDVAKQQLLQVLDQFSKMDAKVRFNITFFHTNPEPWRDALVDTSKANLDDARAYVNKQTPRGGTNIFDSLEQAMQDPDVDTIFLLSDGSPGSGKFVAADDICREIGKINRTRRIVINCIGIEVAGSAEQFLKRLARESGGQYARR